MPPLTVAFGPPPRDELASWSTAAASDRPLAPIPDFSAPPPVGSCVSVGGQDVLVRRTEGPPDGEHAWYVHGLEGASTNWDRLAGALSHMSTGFAPDLPGEGLTGPPVTGRYSLIDEADLCASLIRRRSDAPVHLVGNSRGGVVATFLAARHPQLVRTLTLISPAVPDFRIVRDRGADARMGLVMLPGVRGPIERQLRRSTPAERAGSLAASCFGEPEALTSADLAAAERAYAQRSAFPWSASSSVLALRSLIRAQLRPSRFSWRAAAGKVAVPVLIVWGSRDRLVDARLARKTASRFADHRLLVLPRTGHVAQMERPADVARAMMALWRQPHPHGRPVGAPDLSC